MKPTLKYLNGGTPRCSFCGQENPQWVQDDKFYCNAFCASDAEQYGWQKLEAAARRVH